MLLFSPSFLVFLFEIYYPLVKSSSLLGRPNLCNCSCFYNAAHLVRIWGMSLHCSNDNFASASASAFKNKSYFVEW